MRRLLRLSTIAGEICAAIACLSWVAGNRAVAQQGGGYLGGSYGAYHPGGGHYMGYGTGFYGYGTGPYSRFSRSAYRPLGDGVYGLERPMYNPLGSGRFGARGYGYEGSVYGGDGYGSNRVYGGTGTYGHDVYRD